ncbi:MAG: hypothetical protein N2446_00210 [Elusimicrobiales bacterium]|nr:hypothetical protein [Elusimicrobiales bacterium]
MKFQRKIYKRNQSKSIISFLLLITFSLSLSSTTEIYIGIEKKSQEKPKIAFINFTSISNKTQDTQILNQIKEIVRNDLLFSDYLNVVEIDEKISNENDFIKLHDEIYQFFLSIYLETINEDNINLKANIYNTIKKVKITKTYNFTKNYLRRASHILSDDIIENTVEKKGIASSRITFSNDSTGYKEIYMIDYDGENLTQLTNHKSISIIPKWSVDGKKIYYTTYKYGNPDIAVIDLEKMTTKIFSRFQGLNIAGEFSSDGTQLITILSRGKDPSLYILNLVTREVKNIIENFGICASPTFSPDNKEIAFISDRTGNPQLYIYNLETKKIRRLTKFYWADSPNWSPDGRWIVFSGRETKKENLNIFLIDPTTSFVVRITRNEGDNEDPVFSPDSRYIAFISTRNGTRQIFIMDADGSRPHPLTSKLKGNCFSPSWSKN